MHCKDTILRTQNNWPYSKLIPNSGISDYIDLASETDFAEDGALYPVIEYWCEDFPLSMSIRISHDYSIATISFAKELSLPFIYPLKKGKYIR